MEYLIGQIFWYLVVAFLLGVLVGWLVCRQGFVKKMAALQATAVPASGATMHGTPIETIEGIGTGFGAKLKADGIKSTEALLELCATDEGISRVCRCVDLDENTVRNWGTMADLIRIKGLGGQWAELLWRSGVTSVQDLATRDLEPLRARMKEVNESEHRVAEMPGEHRVSEFLKEAARLTPVLPDRT